MSVTWQTSLHPDPQNLTMDESSRLPPHHLIAWDRVSGVFPSIEDQRTVPERHSTTTIISWPVGCTQNSSRHSMENTWENKKGQLTTTPSISTTQGMWNLGKMMSSEERQGFGPTSGNLSVWSTLNADIFRHENIREGEEKKTSEEQKGNS